MSMFRKLVFSFKSISWLLVLAILLVTFLPAHYHLHHLYSANTAVHEHVIDLHLALDKAGQPHHGDEMTSIISASPDGVMKKSNTAFPLFIVLAMVLVLLPILIKRIKIRLDYRYTGLKKSYPHFSPLLRAPPLY